MAIYDAIEQFWRSVYFKGLKLVDSEILRQIGLISLEVEVCAKRGECGESAAKHHRKCCIAKLKFTFEASFRLLTF